MDTKLAEFFGRADIFGRRIAVLSAADWAAPSACEGWSARDVLDHIIDTERELFAGRGVDLGDRRDGEPTQLWAAQVEALGVALADEESALASYDGWFGPTTLADTLRDFYGFDLIVHAWDIWQAAGKHLVWTEEELAFVETAIPAWGDALYVDGICRPAVDVDETADRQARVLAKLGRRA